MAQVQGVVMSVEHFLAFKIREKALQGGLEMLFGHITFTQRVVLDGQNMNSNIAANMAVRDVPMA